MSNGGRWVEVAQPNGTARRDWRPDEQPPSPDGGPGDWHVVTGSGGPDRWEWVPGSAPAAPLSPSVPTAPPTAGGTQQSTFFHPTATATLERQPSKEQRAARGQLPPALRSKRTLAVAAGILAVVVAAALAVPTLSGGGAAKADPDAVPVIVPGLTTTEQISQEISPAFAQFQVVAGPSGAQQGLLQVQFTNNGAEARSFEATLEAKDAAGTVIATDALRVENLEPGQSMVRNTFTAVSADKFQAMSGATFSISRIQSIATSPL